MVGDGWGEAEGGRGGGEVLVWLVCDFWVVVVRRVLLCKGRGQHSYGRKGAEGWIGMGCWYVVVEGRGCW